MRYLCLAYGSEEDWKDLPRGEQDALLAQDDVLRARGDLVAAVGSEATTLRAWDGTPDTTTGPALRARLPLAGFYIIEAADVDEAVHLLARTPCARAKGEVEIRPITAMSDWRSQERG